MTTHNGTAERDRTAERDSLIDRAIAAGRFPPSRRGHYEARFAADPEGTKRLLSAPPQHGGLACGVTSPVGHRELLRRAFGIEPRD